MWVLWMIVIVVFLLIEAETVNLITIWFAIGSFVALILSLLKVTVLMQFFVFTVVSLLCIALFLKPLKKRFNKKFTPTNSETNIGKTAIVISKTELGKLARVKLDGVDWSARCDEVLEVNDKCEVLAISGATLQVKKII